MYGLLQHKQASAHLSKGQTIGQRSLPRYGTELPYSRRQTYTPELTNLRIRIFKVTGERLAEEGLKGEGVQFYCFCV
jgi:hypothetical protein